jgi:hypothetical protein
MDNNYNHDVDNFILSWILSILTVCLYLTEKIDMWLLIFLFVCIIICFIFPVLSTRYPYYNFERLAIVILICFVIFSILSKLFETRFFQLPWK